VAINCPSCGSDRVTKFTLYEDKKKSKGGGCIGCLLLVIIFILAPGLVLLFGILAGVAVYALRVPLMIAVAVGILLSIIVKIHQSGLYICETCGHKFKP